MLNSIRTRLTLWYLGVLAVVILVFSFAVYTLLARRLLQTTDESLTEISQTIENDFRTEDADLALERKLSAEQPRDEDDDEKNPTQESQEEFQTIEQAITEELGDLRFRDSAVVVLDQNGNKIASGDLNATLEKSLIGLPVQSSFTDVSDETGQFRVYQKSLELDGKPFRLFVVRSYREQTEFLYGLQRIFLVTTPLALLLAGLAGYLLARRKLAPLVSMSDQATLIDSSNLKERLVVRNEKDELGKMAKVFN
ncbi:MAG: HAMP domain-containing protein, partial [Acidobacteria bacterium]|nr:HAMP domain-containing protein [Acidobacteriota bacterium]